MSDAAARVADSVGNWVDSRAPLWARLADKELTRA